MNIKKFLIAGGNPTLLAWGYPLQDRKKIITDFLGAVEQVGFVTDENGVPKLTMMGDELCINATIAFASQLASEGELLTSGIDEPVSYSNTNGKTTIQLILPYKKLRNLVLFRGIGFIFRKKNTNISKEMLEKLAKKYGLPAFGAINIEENRIAPYIYVQTTNSLIKETACGSGSIAANVLYSATEIVQPSGERIFVKRDGNKFTIETNAKKVNF